ncbi:MAG: HIT domain-containing protein [Bdellovibrionota bacterium]
MSSSIPRLWAPWRGEWITSQKELRKDAQTEKEQCPFCEEPTKAPSETNLVLFSNERIFVIMNKFPYNPGHLMVIPRAHAATPNDLSPALWNEINQAIPLVIDCVQRAYSPQGFNLGMNLGQAGGAGIPGHMHWHILPRWVGDTNFMPLLAEAKAINTHNVTIYRLLKGEFQGFAEKLADAMMKSK